MLNINRLKKVRKNTSIFLQKLINRTFLLNRKSTLERKERVKLWVKRTLIVLSVFAIIGVGVFIKRTNALDPSLLDLILIEMKRHSELRARYNARIAYKQRVGEYASIGSSMIQPLIPKKYRTIRRVNYLSNALLNLWMLFIDFYRK